MIIRYTTGENKGKQVDRHRSEAMQLLIQCLAVAIDPLDHVERQVIAQAIEARKASQQFTVLHVTPEDLEDGDIDNNKNKE